jgi:hypothetical protein
METTKTEKLVSLARQVNERRGIAQQDGTAPKYGGEMKRSDMVWMLLAFLGIVSLPMYGWIGGLQTLAGALLLWVFYLIQNRELARQSSTEYMLRLFELRDEFAAYREKYGPSPEEKQEQRRAYAASLLSSS